MERGGDGATRDMSRVVGVAKGWRESVWFGGCSLGGGCCCHCGSSGG